jgi:cold shock CspA family protein
MQGRITFSSGKGWYFAESDADHSAVFVHQNQVENNRYLQIDDRIEFDIAPNPKKPGKTNAVNVKYLGHTVARQTSGEAVRP